MAKRHLFENSPLNDRSCNIVDADPTAKSDDPIMRLRFDVRGSGAAKPRPIDFLKGVSTSIIKKSFAHKKMFGFDAHFGA